MNISKFSKLKIRKDLIQARLNLDQFLIDKYSHIISNKIYKLIDLNYSHKKIIGVYYPHNNEVDLKTLYNNLIEKGYSLALPKIKLEILEFFKWSNDYSLKSGKYNIKESESDIKLTPDIIIIPGIAYDRNFNRIGFGKGYYDKTLYSLKKKRDVLIIAPCYNFQLIDQIAYEAHDQLVDIIVTENEIIYRN